MSRVVTVTQTYTVDGEVAQEATFPITGLKAVEQVGCPPIKVSGFGAGEVSVTFTFDPPLLIPDAPQPLPDSYTEHETKKKEER